MIVKKNLSSKISFNFLMKSFEIMMYGIVPALFIKISIDIISKNFLAASLI